MHSDISKIRNTDIPEKGSYGKLSEDDEFHTRHLILTKVRVREIYERDVSLALNVTQVHGALQRDAPHFHSGNTLRHDED